MKDSIDELKKLCNDVIREQPRKNTLMDGGSSALDEQIGGEGSDSVGSGPVDGNGR